MWITKPNDIIGTDRVAALVLAAALFAACDKNTVQELPSSRYWARASSFSTRREMHRR